MNIFQRIKKTIQTAFYNFTERFTTPTQTKPSIPTQSPLTNSTISTDSIKESTIIPITIPDIPQTSQIPITTAQYKSPSPYIPESTNTLDAYIEKHQSLLDRANDILEQFQSQGVHSVAELDVWENGGYFTFFYSETIEEAVNEVRRALVFLKNPGSTIEGAKIETIELSSEKYKNLFGKNIQDSIKRGLLDADITKRAYEQYRKIESLKSFLIGAVADSSKLIAAMYNWELQGEDSLVLASEYIDNLLKQKENDAINKFIDYEEW